MDVGQYLSGFLKTIKKDPMIAPVHISIYVALLHFYANNGYENPITAYSYEIMESAKISTQFTYLKGVKELSDWGYISYSPSKNRFVKSRIFLIEKHTIEN